MEITDEAFTAKIKAIVKDYPASLSQFKEQLSAKSYSWSADVQYAILVDFLETESVNAATDSVSDESFYERFSHFMAICQRVLKESGIQPKPVKHRLNFFTSVFKRKSR